MTAQPKRVRRTQEDRREEARARILEAAVQLASEKGFDRFTLAEVGEAAGYSRGLPGHYFGSKTQLLYEIAIHVIRSFRARFEEQYQGEGGLEMLLQHVDSYFGLSKQDRANTRVLHRVLAEALSNPELQDLLAGLNRRSVLGFQTEIQAGIDKGTVSDEIDPQATATLILATLRGISSLAFIDRSLDRDALRQAFAKLLTRALSN